MRLRELLSTLAATTSLAACCLDDHDWVHQTYMMPAMAQGMLGELITRCRTGDDCEPLCRYHWTTLSMNNPEGDTEVRDCARDGETIRYDGYATCVAGRRPRGFAVPRPHGNVVGAYFAAQATLEAASVQAFYDVLADLIALGAPVALRAAAMRAISDEIRHTYLCRSLARRYGVDVTVPPTMAARRRSLRELAVDNVVEGCVRETFGAVIAAHQAMHATDPVIRAAMQVIAPDEAAHGLLALSIHDWLAPQLEPDERALLAEHERRAREELVGPVHPELVRVAGLPDAAVQRALFAAVRR